MTNLFVGISRNQVISYETILITEKNKKHINVLITSSTLSVEHNLWNEIIYVKESFNNQSFNVVSSIKNILSKIKTYKKLIAQLQPYKNKEQITLYFTYIEDILTNYLLLSFNDKIVGIVVEDGTLNYYPHTIHSISKKKIFLKWFLSNILGIRFKLYKGHSSGIEYKHVLKQYVRVPELSVFPKKSVPLPYFFKKPVLSNTALIIGQEAYINMHGKKLYNKRLLELISLLKEDPDFRFISKIYYKPHRHGERIDYSIFDRLFKETNFEVLDEQDPLESLYFNKLGSKFIYSFDSSAILNIYLEIDDSLKEQIHFNVLLKYNSQLKPIFEKFKFKVYN